MSERIRPANVSVISDHIYHRRVPPGLGIAVLRVTNGAFIISAGRVHHMAGGRASLRSDSDNREQ